MSEIVQNASKTIDCVQKACIMVRYISEKHDMSGKQLKNYELHPEGSGEVVIKGGELDSGMYMYTMIADGEIIGSKQMILTQ